MNKSALLLIFLGNYEEDDAGRIVLGEANKSFKKLWNMFSASECRALKDKPKVFLFCTTTKGISIQTDRLEQAYEFPSESDILVINHKMGDSSSEKSQFIKQFAENITTYSQKHDIIDLVTHTTKYKPKFFPMFVSTFTRKFFLTPSDARDPYLSVFENHKHFGELLGRIYATIHELLHLQKKKNGIVGKNENKPKGGARGTDPSRKSKPCWKN